MNRSLSVVAALWLAVTATFAQSAVVPDVARACSCAFPLPTLRDVLEESADVTVLVGTVGPAQAEVTPVVVEAWFHGARPADVVWVSGGTRVMSSCDMVMNTGEQRLFVLYGGDAGPYGQNMCSPGGPLTTPEGQTAMAEAEALFGAALAPPSPEPDRTSPPGSSAAPASPDSGWAWLAAGVAASMLLLAGLALLAMRRRPLS